MPNDENGWPPTGRRDTHWQRNLIALEQFARLNGTPMAPGHSTVTVDGELVRVGSFVAYVRQRYRSGRLDESRIAQLEAFEGWTWDGLRPGPRGHAGRNDTIRRLRHEGWTLDELAAEFGMSRQRIHQIAPEPPNPEMHRQRLAVRRDDRRRQLEAAREAVARRGVTQ